jgi:hypothetical protein
MRNGGGGTNSYFRIFAKRNKQKEKPLSTKTNDGSN